MFKDTAIYSIGSLLPKMAGLVLAPIYTIYMAPSDYGLYSLAALLSSAVGVVMLLGQDGSITLLFREGAEEVSDPRELLFSVTLFTTVVSTAVLGLLLLLGPTFTPWLSKDPSFTFRPYVVIALITAWTTVPLSLQRAVNRARGQAGIHTGFQIAQFVVNTAFTLIFVVALKQGAYGSLKGTFLGGALLVPFAIALLVREWKPTLSMDALKRSLKFGLPLVPHYFLGGFLLTFADRLMLARFSTMAAVGLYGYAYNLSMSLNLVSQSINRAWGPIYYDLAGHEEGRRQLPRLTSVYAAVVCLAALGFTMFMPDLLVLISNKRYWPAASIMPIIVGGYFFFAMYMVTSTPIFFARKTLWIPLLSGAAALFNIGINFWLIPAFGMTGAAWATFFAYLGMAAGARWLSGKVGGLFDDRRLATVVGIYLIGFVATLGIQSLTQPGASGRAGVIYDIGLKLATFTVLGGLFLLLRVVTPHELQVVLRKLRRKDGLRRPIMDEDAAALKAIETTTISATSDATGFNPDDER